MTGDEIPNNLQCSLSQKPLSDEQNELSKILAELRKTQTGDGILHLGKDGVLRNLTGKRDVVDAVPLRPGLIKAFLDRLPLPFDQQIEDSLRGVDGTKVAREQWFQPDKTDIPSPPTEEELEMDRRYLEDHAEEVRAIQEAKDRGEFKPCPVVVHNDYNLD